MVEHPEEHRSPLPSFPRRREPRSGAAPPPPAIPVQAHASHVAIVTFARCANDSSSATLSPMLPTTRTLHAPMPLPTPVGKCRIVSHYCRKVSHLLSQSVAFAVAKCRARNPQTRVTTMRIQQNPTLSEKSALPPLVDLPWLRPAPLYIKGGARAGPAHLCAGPGCGRLAPSRVGGALWLCKAPT